ncbi:peptidase M48 Ste24p [Kribbella flavida DSM 17836]|uniref:Peptidase M48 Ste24p n=1 Tax=Kribbella flavida (strain DSM 17836 / JCM 10339 / NBRC 14399) TaxID=479435 RepID=D2Q075_KRIFD|nr:M48 family metallopeptidase [Kribbella flavida]ADB31867.1 peptidase M48 Ste24p [Kribbella flavida DSM 17836]
MSEAAARRAPWVAGALVAAALVVVIVTTTPWHLIDVPKPDAAADFTSAEIDRQQRFRQELLPWSTTSWVLSVLVPLAIGFSPLGRRLYDVLRIGRWYLAVPVLVAGLGLLTSLVTLPTDAFAEQVTRDYGLSTESWGLWLRDRAVNWLLMSAALIAIALGLIALARKWRTWWWAPAAIAGAVLVLGVSFAYPVLVEPRFNEFASMAPGPQRDEFLQLAREDGVPVKDVLVADASKRTTALNAYVSGFGSTRRLVVYDTLLKDASPAQVRLVVAHELGHAAEDDVLHGTLIGTLGAAFAVVLLKLVLGARMADPRRTALLLALVVVGTTLSSPVQNLVSRRIEARADHHSLRLTNDAKTFVEMQRALSVRNISGLEPSRWRYWMFASHPTPPERIAMGRAWGSEQGDPVPPLVRR